MQALTSERVEHAGVIEFGNRTHVPSLDHVLPLLEVISVLRESLERERCQVDRTEAAKERLERRLMAAEDRLAEAESQLEYERGRVDQADRAAAQLGQLWDQARCEMAVVDHARREAEAALCASMTREEALEAENAALKEGSCISRLLRRMTAAGWPGRLADAHNVRRGAYPG